MAEACVHPLLSSCRWACGWATYCMGWDVVHDWMLTGRFEWRVPLRGVVHTWQFKGGRPPMDWWGIQYYSRSVTLHQPNPCLSIGLLGKTTLLLQKSLLL